MPFTYIQKGPIGGTGGDEVPPWTMPDDATIGRIEIKWGDFINQLLFHYTSPSYGQGVISLGGYDSGSAHIDIPLEAGEQITSLSGKCGSYVDSLTITTVKPSASGGDVKQYGPYGGPGGQTFKVFEVPANGRLAGLFGRAGMWTDALGVVWAVAIPAAPIG
ncbi:MAG TPA: jacalin-like lectin [Candidatus Cybelea sp.]|nr:jacalin-like lectin [Candidatus Cybelea sp.]